MRYRDRQVDLLVQRAMLLEDILCTLRLIVEGDVSTDRFHKVDLVLGASRGDDFEALQFRKLNNQSSGSPDLSASDDLPRRILCLRSYNTSTSADEDDLAFFDSRPKV